MRILGSPIKILGSLKILGSPIKKYLGLRKNIGVSDEMAGGVSDDDDFLPDLRVREEIIIIGDPNIFI